MKILLLGKNGQLGWELRRTLASLGSVSAFDYEELNLEDFDRVRTTVREIKPQVIVNASAYTAVDKAENEPDKCFAINGTIPGILAEEAKSLDAALIHFSTDYVFDGCKGSPYFETDSPHPLNVYGSSKLAGETAIQSTGCDSLIIRTSWVYSLRKGGFVNKVLEWARTQETLKIVSDQIANPTWARLLAEATSQILAQGNQYVAERKGLYHLAGSGHTSRLDWTRKIISLDPNKREHLVKNIIPALTSDFPTPALRPLFSALECSKFSEVFGLQLPEWEYALALAQEI